MKVDMSLYSRIWELCSSGFCTLNSTKNILGNNEGETLGCSLEEGEYDVSLTLSVREQLPTTNTAALLSVYEGQQSQIHQ